MQSPRRQAHFVLMPCLLLLAVLLPTPASAVDEPPSDASARTGKPAKVAIFVVKPERFVETIEVKGAFEPRGAVKVAYEPKRIQGNLEVLEAVGPKRVREGELLVRLSDENAVKQVRHAEHALRVARANLEKKEVELQHQEESYEIELAQHETRKRQADEELELFLRVNKPLRISQAKYSLEGSENRIKDQAEELEQLEKMYKADDLTEETEEIVLRRTRRNLDRSRRSLEFARQRHKTFMEVTLPREEESIRLRTRERANQLSRHKTAGRIKLKLAKMDLQKSAEELERERTRFDQLREEVDGLRVRAPTDGLAVPGTFRDGAWHDVSSTQQLLRPGGRVGPRQVLYTIVHPGNVSVLASVSEKDALKLAVGQEAEIVPTVKPDARLRAVVAEVMPVPVKHKIRVRLDLKSTDEALVPGQTCKAFIRHRIVEEALTVPASAVGKHEGKPAVWVWKDGATRPRLVETGARSGDRIEVLNGLEVGARVRAEPPEPSEKGSGKDSDEKDEKDA